MENLITMDTNIGNTIFFQLGMILIIGSTFGIMLPLGMCVADDNNKLANIFIKIWITCIIIGVSLIFIRSFLSNYWFCFTIL